MPNLPKTTIRQNEDQCISGLAIRLPADCRREKETVRGIAGGTKSTTGSAGRIDVHVPCEDILSQINAAKSALHKAGQVVLEGHIRHCVRDGIEHGDAEKTIEGFTKAVERFSNMS